MIGGSIAEPILQAVRVIVVVLVDVVVLVAWSFFQTFFKMTLYFCFIMTIFSKMETESESELDFF